MKVCIHRGTQEIGGSCVEIESQGQRIVLDIGLPLHGADADGPPLPPVQGFEHPDPGLLGVIISHAHLDHYGLAHLLPPKTPFLIGQAGENILRAAALFSPTGLGLNCATHLEDRQPIQLGPFAITPFLVDHSAYDAYAILVQADGRSLFYTGDLRAHGRKGALFEKLLREPPSQVDVLLMEGTTVGRPDAEKGFATEAELEHAMVEVFKQMAGMALVWCSGQNIDRLVTVFRACRRAGRQLIIDMYTAEILRATGNANVPQADWDFIKVFLPQSQKRRIKAAGAFDVANRYGKEDRIFSEKLAAAAPKSVMIFRPSMMADLDQAKCLNGAGLVYSMWSGYLRDEKNRPLLQWVADRQIPLVECHTSGHASVEDLQRLRRCFASAPVVPIHTQHADRFVKLFGNVQFRKDGQWWTVQKATVVF